MTHFSKYWNIGDYKKKQFSKVSGETDILSSKFIAAMLLAMEINVFEVILHIPATDFIIAV